MANSRWIDNACHSHAVTSQGVCLFQMMIREENLVLQSSSEFILEIYFSLALDNNNDPSKGTDCLPT